MKNQQKPTWLTDEQWATNPSIYHWEQSQVAMESLKQSQSQPTSTREQVVQQQRKALINVGLSTKDFDNLHK